jgi:hypothetical protein
MYFYSPGTENTADTIRIAVQAAKEQQISHIVAASNTGETVLALVEEARKQSYDGKFVCVTHVYGFKEGGKNELPDENREKLEKQGVRICTAAHALSGAERGLSRKFQGVYPVEIIAHTLRMMGQGMKVCVEVAVMSLDAGHIPWGKPVIALGGTGRGADTAAVLTPGYSSSVLDTRIHEILCKPRN